MVRLNPQYDNQSFFVKQTNSYLGVIELYTLLQLPPGTIFQQYEALPYCSHIMRRHHSYTVPSRWFSRAVPLDCPPWSLDLNLLAFFPWGYAKNLVYQVCKNNLQQFNACIRTAVVAVIHNMLQNTCIEFEYLSCYQGCPHQNLQ